MADITNIRGQFTSMETMMDKVKTDYPDAVAGIVIVFGRDGEMRTHWRCCAQELAFAGARLTHIAVTDGQDD
jgi:hypothetical protein